jgi:hypothetical protein
MKCIANLGDENPLEYGSLFVLVDEDGNAEFEVIEPSNEGEEVWIVRSGNLDRCTYINGILSDNPYHPDYAVWYSKFAKENLEVIEFLCSKNPIDRARGYAMVASFYSWEEFDQYPWTINNKSEAKERINHWIKDLNNVD